MDQQENKKKTGMFDWLWWWKLDKTNLDHQVSNYDSLGIFHSHRKLAGALFAGSLILTIILNYAGLFVSDLLLERAVIYLPLAFLVYKGNRVGILLTMVFWTFEKALNLGSLYPIQTGTSGLIQIFPVLFWWALLMRELYGAFRVAMLKNKHNPSTSQPETQRSSATLDDHKEETLLEGLREVAAEKAFEQVKTKKSKGRFSLKTFIILAVLIGIASLAGLFYWFGLRPVQVLAACTEQAQSRQASKEDKNTFYRECLSKGGLKPENLYEVDKPSQETTTTQDNSGIENGINDLKDQQEENNAKLQELQDQQNQQFEEQERENRARIDCSNNGGRYVGGTTCVFY